jgi:dTMP kinase
VTKPLFVVLDGADGCGKSTQAGLLVERLAAERAVAPLHVREPGSTQLGERLRAILFDRALDLSPRVELLLFAAARAQLLSELVAPALAQGRDVVCERFHPSTYAYQAVAGGLDEELVLRTLLEHANHPEPDALVVLDVPLDVALARRGAASDRIEAKDERFHARVVEGYRSWARRHARTRLVDATGAPSVVHERVWEAVRRAR